MTIPMIDCHQHLIYPEKYPYAWTDDIPQLAGKSFRYEDYLELVRGKGEIRTIFMEASPDDPHWLEESRFVKALADAEDSIIDGLILNCRPEAEDDFEAYIESVQHPKLVGFRRILTEAPEGTSRKPVFVENVRKLEKYALTFDLCMTASQLPLAFELVAACPKVQFVLDHCGVPDIARNQMDPWSADIQKLVGLPNIACKISGVLSCCAPDNVTIDAVRPYVEHCLEIFGWDRVLWGSDWPVCCTSSGLTQWIDITRELVKDQNPANQHRLYHQNAERIYLKKA